MKYKRSHPINIIEHTSKYLLLLIFPILRALLFTNTSLYVWLRGAWFDILVVAVIVGLGIWAWVRYVYCLANDGIYIKKGIVISKVRFIPYKKLSVLSIEKPFFLLPFGAVRVNADTDGGMPTTPDFMITVNKRELDFFKDKATSPFLMPGEIKRVYLPKNFYIAILSFVVSNTLTGVLFVSTLLSGAGTVFGNEVEEVMKGQFTAVVQKLAVGVPPAAALLAVILFGGWLVSFLLNLIRHLRFSAIRQGGLLIVKSGLITRRENHLTVKRINLIELRQTFVTKLFGFYTAFIHCNGYGKRKDELSILMPAGERHDIQQSIRMLLPEIPVCKPTIRPRLRYLSRFLIPPISWVLGVLAVWILGAVLLPEAGQMIFFMGIMAEIPCIWYLLVKIMSYFHTGVGYSDEVYTFSYTYGYRIKTVAVPRYRIVRLTVRRSLFQVMTGCCDLVILTYSEGRKRHVVPNLNYEEAKKMMDAEV